MLSHSRYKVLYDLKPDRRYHIYCVEKPIVWCEATQLRI